MALKKLMWTGVAIAATLTIGAPSSAFAQAGAAPAAGAAQGGGTGGGPGAAGAQAGGRGRGRGGPTYFTPAPGAKDLKSTLFNWAWYMGQLRSNEEYDVLMTLEYTGKGTVQLDGQPCNLTKYRMSISYRDSAERIQMVGTRPNGQSCNTIEDLSGAYAWNEDIPGAELIAGKGKATPMPNTVEERMIRLWASPQGAWKSAMFGTASNPNAPDMTPRPQKLAADVMTIGKTSVTWEGNKPSITFPIPGVPTATATATLNDRNMPERVVVKNGAKTYEFDYTNYKDWNNPLNPAEAYYAGRMVEKQNGAVTRDITTTVTETAQMYVIVPVPASVKAAMQPKSQPPNWTLTFNNPQPPPPAAAETPRRADGHPDLTGVWGGAPNPITGGGARRCTPTQVKGQGINPEVGCKEPMDNFWVDYEWLSPSRFGVWGLPEYKPEFWDKVEELDQWTNKYDPIMTCQPIGIPRHGTPRRIIQQDKDVIFFYGANADYGGGNEEFRDIPTDGRQRNPRVASLATYYGESIGHWEGDTLVIDSTNFVDTTWFGRGGFFHSSSMHTIERLTRTGNELKYDITIEDPEVLVQPWVMKTRTLRLGGGGFGGFPGGDGIQPERAYCEVYEEGNVTNQLRH
jgi:hypothetical protein